jgi:germination protein YpeB
MQYIKKGEGTLKSTLDGLEELTLAENRADLENKMPKMKGAGMERNAIESSDESGSPKIDPAKAEEMCKTYFSEYRIEDFQCIGETVARGYTAYNVQGFDDKGTMLFAELDYRNGELIRFDYFEPCENMTLDTDNAKAVADKFLQKLGYDDMDVVRVRENGTDVDFTYVFMLDGVAYYPDTVRIKVCRERGVVTGMDAAKYLKNHTTRQEPNVAVTMETAKDKLHDGVEVESAKLAVVETLRGERAAYEFLCSYMGERYFIYTDANNGEEISIVNVKNIG